MLDLKDVRHVACVWYGSSSEAYDFLATLYQKHDASWECLYRFRYYDLTPGATGDPFESKDKKNWYLLKNTSNRGCKEFESELDNIFVQGRTFGVKLEKVEVRGDAAKFREVMFKQPWMHVKVDYPPAKAGKTGEGEGGKE